jgi:acylphosphatase
MKLHIKAEIGGRVQGVGFRYFTARKADEFEIFGYIENNPNGSVYLEAEGEEDHLEGFLQAIRVGPESCEVREFVVMEDVALKYYEAFEIRRKEQL